MDTGNQASEVVAENQTTPNAPASVLASTLNPSTPAPSLGGQKGPSGASAAPALTQDHLDFLNSLQATFRPSEGTKTNPTQARQQKLRELASEVDQAVLANLQKGGTGIPLTSKIAYEFADASEHLLQENQDLQKKIERLENQQKLIQDPNYRAITQIHDTAEILVTDAIDALYGIPDPKDPKANLANQMKAHQKDSFHSMVSAHLEKLIQNNDIQAIKALQKPSNLRALISDFGESVLPPKARDVLKAEALASRPADPQALYEEMRQANTKAKEAKTVQEQRQWEDIATRARRRYLGTRFAKRR